VVLSRAGAARARQAVAVAVGLVPAAMAAWTYGSGALVVDPVADLTSRTGLAAVTFLAASLAVSPAVALLGWRWAQPLRRTLGLVAFGYALAHLAVYVVLDYGLDVGLILSVGVIEKPFILLGFTALLILGVLAATSSRAAMRRLGRRWTALHRLVYVAAILVAIHQAWAVKDPLVQWREWTPWVLVLGLLLALRLPPIRRRLLALRRRPRLAARDGARDVAVDAG